MTKKEKEFLKGLLKEVLVYFRDMTLLIVALTLMFYAVKFAVQQGMGWPLVALAFFLGRHKIWGWLSEVVRDSQRRQRIWEQLQEDEAREGMERCMAARKSMSDREYNEWLRETF